MSPDIQVNGVDYTRTDAVNDHIKGLVKRIKDRVGELKRKEDAYYANGDSPDTSAVFNQALTDVEGILSEENI